MTEGIPPDFDESWPHSDVILLTENSGGKILYANRAVLSVFSPVMAAMFSHNFKEANQDSVEIHVDYEAMKEILRIVFQVDPPTVLQPRKTYDTALLMEIYKAADFLDFRFIRQLCFDQMRHIPSVDIAVAAMLLDLHDMLMEILDKMSRASVETFLSTPNSRLCFSRKDLAVIFQKLHYHELTQKQETSSSVLNLEDIAPEIENPRIDLTKKWFASNVAFLTKNSAERVLYANKGTLASVSEHFRELFFDEKMLFKQFEQLIVDYEEGGRDYPILSLDYEYATMKTILTIVHHCNADYTVESATYNPALLYDMYRVASKDHLDMPNIQKMCVANLLKQPSVESLDVAIRLNLTIKAQLMQNMRGDQLLSWLRYSEGMLIYRDADKDVEISARQSDPVLSLNDVRIVIVKLEYHPLGSYYTAGFEEYERNRGFGGFPAYSSGVGDLNIGVRRDRVKNPPRGRGGRGGRAARRNAD